MTASTLTIILAVCLAEPARASCHFNSCIVDSECIAPLACKLFHELDGPATGCCAPPGRLPSLRGLGRAVKQLLVTPLGTGLMHNTDSESVETRESLSDIVSKVYSRAGHGEADKAADEVVRMALREESLRAAERRRLGTMTTREQYNEHESGPRPGAADIAKHLGKFVAPPAAKAGTTRHQRDDF